MAAQAALSADPKNFRKAARLRELQQSIQRALAGLDQQTADWLAQRFPEAYALGASSAFEVAGGFVWTQDNREAVQRLAADVHSDLLKATRRVRRTTKALVRSIARDAGLQALLEGQTAVQAARTMARKLEANQISAITYSDGSVHGLKEYSEVAIRTKTAVAYNVGTLDHASAHGVAFFEVFDGPFCGWTYHDDPELALGMVVSKLDAESYPISHPNCRRSFGGRPDVADKAQAADLTRNRDTEGSVTRAQVAAQTAADQATAAKQARAARRAAARARANA